MMGGKEIDGAVDGIIFYVNGRKVQYYVTLTCCCGSCEVLLCRSCCYLLIQK